MTNLTLTNVFLSHAPFAISSTVSNQLKMKIHNYIKDKPNQLCDIKCNTAISKAHIKNDALAPGFGFTIQQDKLKAGRYLVTNFKQSGYGYGNGGRQSHKYMSCSGTCKDTNTNKSTCTMDFEVDNGELTKFEHKYIMTEDDFHVADANNDGKLTQEEHHASYHPAEFSMLDTNNDGYVTIDEVNGNITNQDTIIDCSNYGLTGDASGHAFGSDQQGWFCCSDSYNNTPSCSETKGSNENMYCVKNCSNLQCDVSFGTRTINVNGPVSPALTAVNDSNIAFSYNMDSSINIWSTITGKKVRELTKHTDVVTVLATLPNGNIVSGSNDLTIKIWDSTNGNLLHDISGAHDDKINALTTLSGEMLGNIASGSDDCTIKIWDATNGNLLHDISGAHDNWVMALTTLHDGRIASSGGDTSIKFWDATNGNLLHDISGAHKDVIDSLTTIKTNNIASGSVDGNIKIWDVSKYTCINILKLDNPIYIAPLITLNNGNIASGGAFQVSEFSNFYIWNIKMDKPIKTLRGHTDDVVALTKLQDGNIVSGSSDNTIKIWPTG